MGVGLRFGSKIVISISRYGRKITRFTYLSVEEKSYSSSHSRCHSILNADQEPITCAD